MLSRVFKHIHCQNQRFQTSLKLQSNRSFIIAKPNRNFQPIHVTRPPRWRRRRFYRRLTIFSIGFAAWFFMVDADFITYFLDQYRTKQNVENLNSIFQKIGLNKVNLGSTSTSRNFTNKTIWIIGASSGIGEHIAYNLCSLEAKAAPKRIIISARRVNELKRVANKCNNINPMIDIMIKELDVTTFSKNNSAVGEKIISNVFDEVGEDIDILILNSGMIQKCRAEYADMEQFKKLAEVNMFGPIGFTQSMVKQWRFRGYTKHKRKLHQIAVTSSFVGKIGSPGYAFYSLTKHGINGFFESLRCELQDDNIDFNIMCLGPVMPSKGTHCEMGGKAGVSYVREYTDKYGNITTLDRCAQLYVTALKYSLKESWIMVNPYLCYMYGRQYIPVVALPLCKVFSKPFVRDVQRADKNI